MKKYFFGSSFLKEMKWKFEVISKENYYFLVISIEWYDTLCGIRLGNEYYSNEVSDI